MKQNIKKGLNQHNVKDFLYITAGTLCVTLGVYFFKFPNNFSTGGVTGAAILLSGLFGDALSSSTVVLIANVTLLIIGYLVFGRSFGLKTAYASLLMSFGLKALEYLLPLKAPLTDEPLLEIFFAVLLPGIGSAVLFHHNASTGGTDVVAMILKKHTNINIGQALMATDLLLTFGTFPLFGIKTGMLCVLGLIIKSLVVDNIIESLNLCKYFTIICDNPEPICQYIIHELNRSATVCDGTGAFSEHKKSLILAVMKRGQALQLQQFIKQNDPEAFILITNTSEIIGRGFRRGY